MDKCAVLKQYFGHSEFRPGQGRLIDCILSGRDAIGIMPTGGGKSLCYQVPAMLMEGVTLVISPLISLMADQVAALQAAGIGAAYINSSLSPEELRYVYDLAWQGEYKIIYVAPERLDTKDFIYLARGLNISLVAIDEAHCVSQWGQNFRPSYLRIPHFIGLLPRRPVLAAFTATATEQVRRDIERLLELQSPLLEISGFDRPNLYFDVLRPNDKMAVLTSLIKERRDKSGIVYCATRKSVERICEALCQKGIEATRYHAGLDDIERRQNQEDFQFDRKTVMVATNAFGMGIDKSNVGYVIHYNMPKSLEAYYQEAGRAGRDGQAADCLLLYSPGDIVTAKFLIENSGEELNEDERQGVRESELRRLNAMIDYCKSTACLRGCILDYFGQTHPENCGNCGSCKGEFTTEDITVPAQMILSCIIRVRELLGYYVGKTLIIQTLRGSKDRRVLDLRLDTLSTYGLMSSMSIDKIRGIIDYMELEGYAVTKPAHSTLEPGG